MEYVTQGMALLSEGFDATNAILGLVLAILAAWTMRSISQIILISLFTTAITALKKTLSSNRYLYIFVYFPSIEL